MSKKVPDRVGSGLMFGGGDAVFDKLFEIAKVTPQSSGKQKRFDDRTNFNREFCGATKKAARDAVRVYPGRIVLLVRPHHRNLASRLRMRGCSCSDDQPRIARSRSPRITSSVFTLSVAAAPGLIPALRVVLKLKNLVRTVAIGFGNENASAIINKALEKEAGIEVSAR
jgi:hypothetical protein